MKNAVSGIVKDSVGPSIFGITTYMKETRDSVTKIALADVKIRSKEFQIFQVGFFESECHLGKCVTVIEQFGGN